MSELQSAVWGPESSLHAFWIAENERPEWIAERTDALLQALGSSFAIAEWSTPEGHRWEDPLETLTDIVREFVIRDSMGQAEPVSGYGFSVGGLAPNVDVTMRVSAGAASAGLRLPLHHVSVKLVETTPSSLTGEDADRVCAAVAQVWQPAMMEFADHAVRRITRRGNWKIGVGYRTWISDSVGSITDHANGLTVRRSWGGTLISAPDDWPPEAVRDTVLATLQANGLDEVPH